MGRGSVPSPFSLMRAQIDARLPEAEADADELGRKMAQYGIEFVGPPPTLE
jgi:hypothetical protein